MNWRNFFTKTYLHCDIRLGICWLDLHTSLCDHSHGSCITTTASTETEKDEIENLMQPDAAPTEPLQRPRLSQEEDQSSLLSDQSEASTKKQADGAPLDSLQSTRNEVGDIQHACISCRISLHIGATCILVALSIAIVLFASVFLASPSPHVEHTPATQTIARPNDYILDPDWNFNADPTRREYYWTISDMQLNPDGIYRPMTVINRQFPGPLIECNDGDTIVVHIDNQAVNATSIHWHGLFQNGTNFMDGTVGVTQCPIAPKEKFTYEFQVKGQSGTYWYHGHHGLQASDGLLGPFVVHSKEERELQEIQYATDRVLMIQDHYHDLSGVLLMKYLRPDQENTEPVPDSALINGRNIRVCDDFPHRTCDNSTADRPQLDLEPNKAHRIRFINVGTFAEFQIQIDEHEFAVTEVDGTDVLPAFFHRLNIQPAQRYSIVISTNVTGSDLFWLRARMITYCFSESNPYLEPEIRAVVRYAGNESSYETTRRQTRLPNSKDWPEIVEVECKDMNSTQLIPAKRVTPPIKADAFFYLRSNFEIGAWRLSRGFFNQSSWRANERSPILSRAIDGLASENKSFSVSPHHAAVNSAAFDTKNELVIQTNNIQTVDIAIQNFDDGSHPMHLHGYKFFVLATGHGHFDASQVYPNLDLSNPLRRDTASLDSYGWLLIRLVADNPGVWALHCHVTWHTEAGLLMNLLTRADVVKTWEVPGPSRALCKAKGLEKGSSPKDEIWFGGLGG